MSMEAGLNNLLFQALDQRTNDYRNWRDAKNDAIDYSQTTEERFNAFVELAIQHLELPPETKFDPLPRNVGELTRQMVLIQFVLKAARAADNRFAEFAMDVGSEDAWRILVGAVEDCDNGTP